MFRSIVIVLFICTVSLLSAIQDSSLSQPEFTISLEPSETNFGETYYDYMPGGYTNTPVRTQSDELGGTYFFWHKKPAATASSLRRVYYSYLSQNGVNSPPTVVDNSDDAVNLWEGYASADLDPDTGVPFFAYHVNNDDDPEYEIAMGLDNFHLGASGIISPMSTVIDNTDLMADHGIENADFIWPNVYVSNHPSNDNLKRVYIIASNASDAYDSVQAGNLLIAYADFDINAINPSDTAADADWTYLTIPELDQMAVDGHRPYISVANVTEDGKVCIFGNVFYADGASENQGLDTQDLWIAYSDNYCENGFTFTQTNLGKTIDWVPDDFTDEGDRYDFHWSIGNSNHMNAVWTDDHKLLMTANTTLSFYLHSDDSGVFYSPGLQYPRALIVDPIAGTVDLEDIFPRRDSETHGGLFLPWDVDEDDVFDVDEAGENTYFGYYPHVEYESELAAACNNFRITKGGMYYAAIWFDGTYNRYGADPEIASTDYASWIDVPEIAISFSADAIHWSDPLFISAHQDEENTSGIAELKRSNGESMKPNYIYPASRIKYIGDGLLSLGLFFLDDELYGNDHNEVSSGTQSYMEINVSTWSLNYGTPIDNPSVDEVKGLNAKNYPNPFNPQTIIEYNVPELAATDLTIYNILGQKIKTIVDNEQQVGNQTFIWSGNDDQGNSVASGVYFYRIKSGKYTSTKKMILMK